jgi:hypothetical protein
MKWLWLLVWAALVGCAPALKMSSLELAALPPANVSALVLVESPQGPVMGLPASAFKITEDKNELRADEVSITQPDLSTRQVVLVLVDIGGHKLRDEERQALIGGMTVFIERLATEHLAIYLFDGSEDPRLLVAPSATKQEAHDALAAEGALDAKDPSTNLHGAVRASIATLREAMAAEEAPLGVFVLVSRGPDRAARVTSSEMEKTLDEVSGGIRRYALGLGADAKLAPLQEIASTAPTYAEDTTQLANQLLEVVDTIHREAKNLYLVTYCSQARAGEHQLKIEVERSVPGESGEPVVETGKLTKRFSAEGFGPGCVLGAAPTPPPAPPSPPPAAPADPAAPPTEPGAVPSAPPTPAPGAPSTSASAPATPAPATPAPAPAP